MYIVVETVLSHDLIVHIDTHSLEVGTSFLVEYCGNRLTTANTQALPGIYVGG